MDGLGEKYCHLSICAMWMQEQETPQPAYILSSQNVSTRGEEGGC